MADDWKYVIWSDESFFTLFGTSGWFYVWRVPKGAWNPECLVPTVKHGGGSVMIWAAISWYCAGPIITLNGRITASDCVDILGNQVHAIVQMLFSDNDAVFQDDSLPIHTAKSVHSWIEEHEYALQHLLWPAQSPDLNIVKSLWSVSDNMVRSRFPLPSCVKQLQDVLYEEWCSIPLETIQNVCESIPRRIQTITVKWWLNSILINKCVFFTTISIILSIPCSFTCCISLR